GAEPARRRESATRGLSRDDCRERYAGAGGDGSVSRASRGPQRDLAGETESTQRHLHGVRDGSRALLRPRRGDWLSAARLAGRERRAGSFGELARANIARHALGLECHERIGVARRHHGTFHAAVTPFSPTSSFAVAMWWSARLSRRSCLRLANS